MHNQRYQSIRTFSVSLLVMSLFMLGANMEAPTPDDAVSHDIDLELSKSCEADPGGSATGSIHLTLFNNGGIDGYGPGADAGDVDATGVEVTDWKPEFITFTSSKGDGSFNLATGVWTVGTLVLDETAEIWIFFEASEQGEYSNHAEVTAADQDDHDSTPDDKMGDDYDSCTFVISERGIPDFVPERSPSGITERGDRFEADLEASKIVTDNDGNEITTATVGSMVHYKVSIKNLGPHSTAKVQAKDQLPACLSETSATPSRGTYDADTGLWNIGAIKKDETVTLEAWGTVSTDCSGTVTNGVWITRSTLPDPSSFFNSFGTPPTTLLNNHAEASFEVTAAANGRVLDGTTFELGHSYPNPFNPTTLVPFSLAEASHVSIRVYDMLGREVSVLVDRGMAAGVHEVTFEANTLPTGVYLIRMEAAGTVQIQRVTLMK